MKSLIGFLAVLVLCCTAQAEQQRLGGTEAQYAALQKFHDDAIARFNSGDVDATVADYLDRVRVALTGSMAVTGLAPLEERWRSVFAEDAATQPINYSEILEMEINGDEVGDWAYIIGAFATTMIDRETRQPVTGFSNGRYIALMEMTEDGWKFLLDIDNGAAGSAPQLEARLKAHLGL
jgi:hypothetical protein